MHENFEKVTQGGRNYFIFQGYTKSSNSYVHENKSAILLVVQVIEVGSKNAGGLCKTVNILPM